MNESKQLGSGSAPRPAAAIFVLSVVIALWAALMGIIPAEAPDLFWQVRAGEQILQTGQAPHTDVWSWSRQGAEWIAPEWLFFALLALVHRVAGFAGTWILTLCARAAAATVIFHLVQRRVSQPVLAFALAVCAMTMADGYFQPRPQIATFLLLPMSIGLMIDMREGKRPLWWLFVLVPVTALWANLHQGVVVMVATLGLYGCVDVATSLWLPGSAKKQNIDRRDRGLKFIAASAACFAATLSTPYGVGIYSVTAKTVGNVPAMLLVGEWEPYAGQTMLGLWLFPVMCALVVVVFIASWRSADLGDALVCAALIVEAFMHVRNIPLFALGGIVIASRYILLAFQLVIRHRRFPAVLQKPAMPGIDVVLCAIWSVLVAGQSAAATLKSVPPETRGSLEALADYLINNDAIMGQACAFIAREQFPTDMRLYNDYDAGGYIIYHLPAYRVFIDGRADVYIGDVLDDYTRIAWASSQQDCQPVLNKYCFDAVITSHPDVASYFATDPTYAIVYADHPAPLTDPRPNVWIYLKRRPDYVDFIGRVRQDWARERLAQVQTQPN